MSESRLQVYLHRMQLAARRAADYVADMDKEAFESDRRTQDAVIANIAAMGECATKIVDRFSNFVTQHPEIPWKDIRAMRNRVAHQYFEIDTSTIWITAKIKLPELLKELSSLRSNDSEGE